MIRTLAAALATTTCLVAFASPATAQTRDFNIPAGSLRAALDLFARQSGRQVIYRGDEVRSTRSPGVRGARSAEDALEAILAGTGFRAQKDSSGAFAVAKVGNAPTASETEASSGERIPSATDADDQNAEIVVTGSHIRGTHPDTSPMQSITRKQILSSGASSVQELLRSVPQNFTGGASEYGAALSSQRNGNDQNLTNGAGINLRGLGNSSTLVLLNGHRMAPGGLGAFVDVSSLPVAALERVDVVADGASAIYGSDAVAGTVNFILRDNYKGAETSVTYGGVTSGNLREFNATQLVGTTWDSGAILVEGGYRKRTPLFASDRDYANAFAGGSTDLIPPERSWNLLVNGHQDLADNIKILGTGYFNSRNASTNAFFPLAVQTLSTLSKTKQYGGTVELDWRLGSSWNLSLSETYSHSRTNRFNEGSDSIYGPGYTSTVVSGLSTYSTEGFISGTLAELPAGPLKVAAGGEFRRETIDEERSNSVTPGVSSFGKGRDIEAAYVEANIPIISATNRTAWARALSIVAAARVEHYSDFGTTTNPKVGLVWEALKGLRARATYSTSFRAAYLSQFDPTLASGYVDLVPDPTSATGDRPVAALFLVPSPNLGPEKARTWSAGLDYSSDSPNRISAHINYYNIVYTDRIAANYNEFSAFIDPTLSPLVSTPPNPEIIKEIAALPPEQFFDFAGVPLSDVYATFDGRIRNISSTRVSGIDVSLEKVFDTSHGTITAAVNATYMLTFKNRITAAAPLNDILNTVFNPVDLRARFSVDWRRGRWAVTTFANYTNGYRDNQALPSKHVHSWTTLDLNIGYEVPKGAGPLAGLSVSVNAINLFDADPPRIVDLAPSFANQGYDTENANPLGRLVRVTISKKW